MRRIKEFIKRWYAEATRSPCCHPSPQTSRSRLQEIGYSLEELRGVPASALEVASGCGSPVVSAALREGEVVLDLGCGGGVDVFLAALRVGVGGKAIGVDMTPEMIERARRSAEEMGFSNVEFRLGEIEDLPIEDESMDVVISNCVINLSPDKSRVFQEAYRVLRPGGRIIISDIVVRGELSQSIRESLEAWAGCVAGAVREEEYLRMMREAGFADIEVLSRRPASCGSCIGDIYSIKIRARKSRD